MPLDTAAASGPEAQDAGANRPTGMPTEAASGDEPERMSAAQDQDAALAAQPDAMDQAPPPYGVKEGADRPTANRSRRRRASPLEAGDAKAFKQRARAKRSDRREAASMAKDVPVAARTEAADADADAQTTRRSRRAVEGPVKAAADTEPAPKRRSREKPSTSDGERGKAAEKSQTAASAGASGPPWQAGIGVRTEPGVAIGDLAGQAALAAARPAEVERAVASAGLPVDGAVEPSIATVTAELAEFAFRSMEEGMASLRELSRITTLPELAEFQARQAQAAVAAWQQHAARMNEIYGALLKPKDKSRK